MIEQARQPRLPGFDPGHATGHLLVAKSRLPSIPDGEDTLLTSLTGRFYTPDFVAKHLINALVARAGDLLESDTIAVCDPFGGDGRLIRWFFEALGATARGHRWHVELWDLDEVGLHSGRHALRSFADALQLDLDVHLHVGDTFSHALSRESEFDVVLTNPPWENIKPDSRELARMNAAGRLEYVEALKKTDAFLAENYARSQPHRKYGGWGTNLSRAGSELALRLAPERGFVGLVVPTSFLADDTTRRLRTWMLSNSKLHDVANFPAEARAFDGADVSAATIVLERTKSRRVAPIVTSYDKNRSKTGSGRLTVPTWFLESSGHVVPIGFGMEAARFTVSLGHLPTLSSIESAAEDGLWAGRELDETRASSFLVDDGTPDFLKGRMIERFSTKEVPSLRVEKADWSRPQSVAFERIAWRDVSRPNQKRRVQATLIPAGRVCGNSLGVAHFRDGDGARLRWLLGVMSSVVFEVQLRAFLATGHVTLNALRKVRIPTPDAASRHFGILVDAVDRALEGSPTATYEIEAAAAHLYGIDADSLARIIDQYPKIEGPERAAMLGAFGELTT